MSDNANPYNAPDTGHLWDDNLRELTNDPPAWWMIGFHASWILVLVYGLIYPMWPTLTTHTKGFADWTSIKEYKEDLQLLENKRAKYEDQLQGLSAEEILADNELSNYVVRSAKVLFGDNCAACHGAGGRGNLNYPVLADDDWLYGGTASVIQQTITIGRNGLMTANANMLSDAEADELADAVMAGNPTGTPLYLSKACVACHGIDGKGNQLLGAADLTDKIWRFPAKDQRASVKYTILHGVNDPQDKQTRNAVMPKFGGTKLTETDIKKLTVYVHKLGGGQ